MSLLRWTALGLAGMAGAAAIAVFLWPGAPGVLVLAIAAALAALIGGGAWRLAGILDAELAQLHLRLDDLAAGQPASGVPARSRFGLDDLWQRFERETGRLGARVTELSDRCRQQEIAARMSELQRLQFDAMLEGVRDAVIVTDALNEVAVANGPAGRLLGFDARDAAHRPVEQVLHDPHLLKLIKDTRRCDRAAVRRIEHRVRAEGHDSVCRVTVAPITGADRQPTGVITVLHELAGSASEAAACRFIANVAHEMRTPLTSIKAYLEMLVDGEARSAEDHAQFCNVIQGEVNRLSGLVENLLTIHRIESGLTSLPRELLSLSALASEAAESARPMANARGIHLFIGPAPGPMLVLANRETLFHALSNLLDNAVKYTAEGGRVDLRLDAGPDGASVEVADTGVGIPADQLPRLFEKFYRVTDHKALSPGTGLGLNLVRQVVESVHGGKLSVHSTVGRGSTFRFTLPIADNL